jgi:plasmid maintenance system antidote protein VapI
MPLCLPKEKFAHIHPGEILLEEFLKPMKIPFRSAL